MSSGLLEAIIARPKRQHRTANSDCVGCQNHSTSRNGPQIRCSCHPHAQASGPRLAPAAHARNAHEYAHLLPEPFIWV